MRTEEKAINMGVNRQFMEVAPTGRHDAKTGHMLVTIDPAPNSPSSIKPSSLITRPNRLEATTNMKH